MPAAIFSKEEVLLRFSKKYNNEYSYPNFKYSGLNSKITIKCRIHGNFIQRMERHLNGNGRCRKCIFKELKDTLSEIHKNKYLYNNVKNISYHNKNIITCKIHGNFVQSIKSHKNGSGCNKCAIEAKTGNLNSFLKKANKKHNNKFNYSKFNYINSSSKSVIICPNHGEFKQTPNAHLYNGCKKCSGNSVYTNKTFKKTYFTKYPDSKLILNNIKYVNGNTKITVKCPLHSEHYYFNILPRLLLTGHGCSKCGGTKKLTTKEFIEAANAVHNYKYNYNNINYTNTRRKISIICDHHDEPFEFKQTAGAHIHNARGCPKCSNIISKPEQQWIKSFNNKNIQVQVTKTVNGRRFRFDGYDPTTNTVYEFYGDFWHGNPKKFNQEHTHPIKKIKGKPIKYKDVYEFTLEGERILREAGYNLVTIWESDFKTS